MLETNRFPAIEKKISVTSRAMNIEKDSSSSVSLQRAMSLTSKTINAIYGLIENRLDIQMLLESLKALFERFYTFVDRKYDRSFNGVDAISVHYDHHQ